MEKLLHKECENCTDWNGNICHCMEICDYPIDALEEFNEYRQIGTVDECRAAMEKQIPKEPLVCGIARQGLNGNTEHTDTMNCQDDCYECPSCGSFLGYVVDCNDVEYQCNFCQSCGQALKWGD